MDHLQQVDFNMSPGTLSVSDDGTATYLLFGDDQKIVCLLVLQPDGSVSCEQMSTRSNPSTQPQPPLVPTSLKPPTSVPMENTIPPQLAALGLSLDTRLQVLSVKDGVGIHGAYNGTQELLCLVS